MHTIDKIQKKLEATKLDFVKKIHVQGEFWCPLCNKWLLAERMFQIIGHCAPDRLVIYGLCEPCTAKAAPNWVAAVIEAIRERGNKIEEVDQRLKFVLIDGIFQTNGG